MHALVIVSAIADNAAALIDERSAQSPVVAVVVLSTVQWDENVLLLLLLLLLLHRKVNVSAECGRDFGMRCSSFFFSITPLFLTIIVCFNPLLQQFFDYQV